MSPKVEGLKTEGSWVVPFADQCGLSAQNVKTWKSGDLCCPRKRQLSTSWACTEPFFLVFWTSRGRLGQGQLEKDRRGGLELT